MSDAQRTTSGQGRLYDSVVDTIGNTPCIRVNRLAPDGVTIYVKSEFFNPAASVKDRLAISIIEEAERRGDLKLGQTVVEATSGNTGIGLAMVCAAKGYPLVVTMADSFSIERRKLMRFLGAQVILTPRAEKGFGMYNKAVELAEANGWFLARQFETPDNATIHENTTAREILADFNGKQLDYYVTGYGTGGTVTGVARVLRKERPDTKIILSEPANAQIVGGGHGQERNAWAQKLAAQEGIMTGVSGGSTFAIAMQVAEKAPAGSVICCMLPDTSERYLSSPLFEGVEEEMTADEIALSKSTPGYHMPDS
jgi:cysteine synthase A